MNMSSVKSIVQSLVQLTTLHEQLITCAEDKKDAIIRNDVDQVSAIMHKETKVVKHVQSIELELQDHIGEYLQGKGIRSKLKLTISEVSRLVFDAEERELLSSERDRLVETINQLKRLNERNQDLIKQSLSFIDFSLNIYMGVEDDGFYTPDPAQMALKKNARLFDSRA